MLPTHIPLVVGKFITAVVIGLLHGQYSRKQADIQMETSTEDSFKQNVMADGSLPNQYI
jgi:hypothetical protein